MTEMSTIVRQPESFGEYQSRTREYLFNAIWDGLKVMYDFDEESNTFTINKQFIAFPDTAREGILAELFKNSWEGIR